MKKRVLLYCCFIVVLGGLFSPDLLASPLLPEDPFAQGYILSANALQQPVPALETPFFANPPTDTIPPLQERPGDFLNSSSGNPFDLQDPADINQTVEYDPETGQYILYERLGDDYFRPPTYMTFEEYMTFQSRRQETDYFRDLSGVGSARGASGRPDPIAKVDLKNLLIERLFGGTEVDIRPQGNIDLTFGAEFTNTQNPSYTQRQQRIGGFLFDMDIQMNVEGSIGEKLKLKTNYNTQATFDFDNIMKIDYNTDAFGEDDIIKKIEAGNVSLPLRGSLITGSQSLFGLKTELQFGRLRLTAVASQQKSEQEEIVLKGGSQYQTFEVTADEYDENRHFFLTHYNRNNFEEALQNLPQIKTLFTIENIQVWVTDTRNATQEIRDIVAVADLGETTRMTNNSPDMQPPPLPVFKDLDGEALPDNYANPIYGAMLADPQTKVVDRAVARLKSPPFNLQQGKDFEKVTARRLSSTEFTYHPNLGYISLNINIQPNQVVGVAFEYSYGDSVYQVGQIAEDIPQNADTTQQNVLFVKMLKSTIQPVDLPTWDLMMKNVYNIGAYNVSREDFKLDIFYEDPGKGKKRFLPESNLEGVPLLRVFNLDQLNVQSDPQPDGVFDFIPGLTINPRNGRIMFPVLEPFGKALGDQIDQQQFRDKFIYPQLYTQTLFNAREFAEFNRFTIEGTYKSSVSSEISLGAFNIPPGSVTVTAGGQVLIEDKDYKIDYQIGRVTILNDAVLNAGVPIRIKFEDNTLFGFQTKTMLGLRADFTVNKNLTLGGTYLHLFERPFTQKVNIGDDPINNRIIGLDVNYSKEAPWLTKLVDKLPFYSTKEMSNLAFTAEAAALKPGHARAINETTASTKDKGGVNYLDDFEGSVSSIDLRAPFIGTNGWVIASVPQNDSENNNPFFPESEFRDTTLSGVNRALLNWYRIDPSLRGGGQQNPYTQAITQQEIFPNFTPQGQFGDTYAQILDLSYDPTRRGPYNFDTPLGTDYSKGINSDGTLRDPATRWGGIMRQLTTNDFQTANIEFVEFWMMSPYLDTTGATGGNPTAADGSMNGYVYLNFGNISEDILLDSRKFFENGLPGPETQGLRTTETAWGKVPLSQQIVTAFDVNPANREAQDVGLDGLSDEEEVVKFDYFLQACQTGVAPDVYQSLLSDPSNDNFRHFRDFPNDVPVLERYSRFFGTEGNTPINTGETFVTSSTLLPDSEDLDGDRTLNETESYFQYRIPIEFDGDRGIRKDNNPFITDEVVSVDGRRVWYRFRVPLNLLESDPNFKRVGGIRDFRSIRFIRMYLKDFERPVNLRFATFELVRNQWRRYTQSLGTPCAAFGGSEGFDQTAFDVNTVNIEENSKRSPFGYIMPPGISREQALGVNLNALQNEASLSLRVCDLEDGDARAIFKNLNEDLRRFKKLKMFVHGEEISCGAGTEPLQDGELSVFIRIGSDFKNNFYEYELPLTLSRDSTIAYSDSRYPRVVWPVENDFSIDFDLLKTLKIERNQSGEIGKIWPVDGYPDPENPLAKVRIKGNPNLGLTKAVMIGVRNTASNPCSPEPSDKKSVEIWVNELRVFGLDERGGVAATARLDLQIADLGTMSLSGKVSTIGFGGLDQQLQQRSIEQITSYDLATQISLDKFLPEKLGLRIPFYFAYSNETRNPQFDPYDLDIELKDNLELAETPEDRAALKERAQNVTSIKTYNFTNVRKEPSRSDKLPMPWNISNFSLTYGFDETQRRDPIIESDVVTRERGAIDYKYNLKAPYIEPFKKVVKNDKYLKFLKEMNLNPLPNSYSFSTDLDRRFNTTKYRFAGDDPLLNTYFNKQFLWNRFYDLQWDITRNLKFQFNADNQSVIDEPDETRMLERSQLPANHPLHIADIAQYRKDSILTNLRDLGRTKNYRHNYNLSYNVPLKNFPFMDWVNVKARWEADYSWSAASQSPGALSLGNVIQNGNTRGLDGDMDFEKLYNYSGYLKKINSKGKPGQGDSGSGKGRGQQNDSSKGGGKGNIKNKDAGGPSLGGDGGKGGDNSTRDDRKNNGRAGKGRTDTETPGQQKGADGNGSTGQGDEKGGKKGKKDSKEKGEREPSTLERVLIRPLMVLRSANLRYTEKYGTVVPGYLPDSKLFGMDNFNSPGWDFVAGLQPNIRFEDYYTERDWLHNNWRWITGDQYLNSPVIQNYSQTAEGRVKLEPFPNFKIDVDIKRNKQENHNEFFRRVEVLDPDNPQNRFQEEMRHNIPKDFGSYTISYAALGTLFNNDLTGLFQTFEENRLIVARRLSDNPAILHGDSVYAAKGYPKGFGPLQQNVSLPAFFAAYVGMDPNTMELSKNYMSDVILKTLPRPNWRLTYNGLSKLDMFKDIFQSFTLNHAYQGTLTVGSYTTDLDYDPATPQKVNNDNLNFYSRFRAPNIQLQEQFSPFLGVDMKLKNDVSMKFDYKTGRTLNVELDRGLNETKGTEFTIGFGYKMKDLKIGFLTPKKKGRKPSKEEEQSQTQRGGRPGRGQQSQAGDFDFTFDFSLRDDITTFHAFDSGGLQVPTRGNRTVTILPQATYQLSKQLSLRFFFDYRRNVPKTSQGFPTTNVRSGVTVRFSLQ
jgi:cell surface protein SprA